jgi:tetratricopeptide (TPR) repeat protein
VSVDATVDQVLHTVAPRGGVDRATLERLIHERPDTEQLVDLLNGAELEAVRAAVVYLGAYGSVREGALLATCLHHDDPAVVELAENGLWSIWMQGGSETGNRMLALAIGHLNQGDFEAALRLLTALNAREPFFAEPWFQKGVALALVERHGEASVAYRRALHLNPQHFSAAAALGHACVEQGNLSGALHYYRQAVDIHPRLEELPAAVRALEAKLGQGPRFS